MPKKIETTVTAGRNGGIHDVRQYKQACKWIEEHTFTNAQLFHMVFKGSDNRRDYETALDRLCEKLRDSGMPVEWRAAYEQDPAKGFHRHVFLMIEAKDHKPLAILHYREGGWLVEMLKAYGLEFHIAPPAGLIHRTGTGKQKSYAYVPKKPGAMLDDCKNWLSYIFKVRSKEGVEGPVYSSSRKRAKKAEQAAPVVQAAPQAAPVAPAPHEQSTTPTNERTEMGAVDGLCSSIYRGITTWRRYVQHRAGRKALCGIQSAHCQGGRVNSIHARACRIVADRRCASDRCSRFIVNNVGVSCRDETASRLYRWQTCGLEESNLMQRTC